MTYSVRFIATLFSAALTMGLMQAATLTVSSIVTVPQGGSVNQVYTDSESVDRLYTLLVTGGTGTGFVHPLFELQGAMDFCCTSASRAVASLSVMPSGASFWESAGSLQPPQLTMFFPVEFTFGVAENFSISLSSLSTVAGPFGGAYPAGTSVQGYASFTAPSACYAQGGNASSQTMPCNIAFGPATPTPEPISVLLVGAGLFALALKRIV